MESVYFSLKKNPPKLEVKEYPRQVIFTMVSCMCDNKSYIFFNRKENGDFSMHASLSSGMGFSFSNYSTGHPKHEILWKADEGDWSSVIKMLNNGTSVVQEIKSR